MKNIVLPVDFSDTTDVLIDGAVDFAKEVMGKICLIHVAPADIGFAIGDMGFQYFPEIEKSEIAEELSELNELQKRIESKGVGCEHILKQGVSADIILNYAKEKNASYIVMGSHGRSGIFILGGARYQIFSSVFFRRRFRPDFYSYRVGSL